LAQDTDNFKHQAQAALLFDRICVGPVVISRQLFPELTGSDSHPKEILLAFLRRKPRASEGTGFSRRVKTRFRQVSASVQQ
jgi:hypothetical protein